MKPKHICTREDPWESDIHNYGAEHPDAKYCEQIDGWPGGDLEVYECPNCGLRFTCELPQ